MRDDHRFIKSILEMWGIYKRQSVSVLGLPKSTPAFDPENYEYQYASPPSWKRKRIPQKDEKNYRQMRQQSTKPSMGARIPNYISNTRMNYIDTLIKELPDVYQKVAEMKFIEQLNDKEIAAKVQRSTRAIEKRVERLYQRINNQIDYSSFRKKTRQKYDNISNHV